MYVVVNSMKPLVHVSNEITKVAEKRHYFSASSRLSDIVRITEGTPLLGRLFHSICIHLVGCAIFLIFANEKN